ncbi:MAG: type II toxin-antitoxin system HicB family antitoxin [Candidatus Symbiodolus clandestinus]
MFNYPVKLQRDTQGAYLVTCRDLPDTVSGGNTQEQALEKVVSSLVKTVADYIEHRRPVPLASIPEKNEHVITLPILVVAKTALWNAMVETGTRKTDLARLLGVHLPQVDRLLNVKHSSKIESIESALQRLGRKLRLQVSRCHK